MGISIPSFLKPIAKKAVDVVENLAEKGIDMGVEKLEDLAVKNLPKASNFAKNGIDTLTDKLAVKAEDLSDKFIDAGLNKASQWKWVGGFIGENKAMIGGLLDNVIDPVKYEGKVDQLANKVIDDVVMPRAEGLVDVVGEKVEDVAVGLLHKGADKLNDWLKLDEVVAPTTPSQPSTPSTPATPSTPVVVTQPEINNDEDQKPGVKTPSNRKPRKNVQVRDPQVVTPNLPNRRTVITH